jgi:hypothetical protein
MMLRIMIFPLKTPIELSSLFTDLFRPILLGNKINNLNSGTLTAL